MVEETPSIQILNFQTHKPARTSAKETKHADILKSLTLGLVDTYSRCSEDFQYSLQLAPRRVLTKLAKGVHNHGYDNAEHDYICRVGDKIQNPENTTYEIMERLGQGTFGQVLKCQDSSRNTVALKIIKNKPAYFHQALVEVHILKMLNNDFDPEDELRIVRMRDFFVYRKHLCIAFELLSVNLYDVLKQNSFRGVSMALIRVLTEQLLRAMQCLREASIIHCDLKPENVLLSNMQHTKIKLIDFGSACFENHTVYSYIQSRFYRSPEVLLGLSYTTAIDMWSLGCICAELFLGLPIFPGHSEYDQVCRHVEILGLPPVAMLEHGRNTRKYFRSDSESESENERGDKPKRERKKKEEFDLQKCYELIILEEEMLKMLLKDGSLDRDAVEKLKLIRNALIKENGMLRSSREQAATLLLENVSMAVDTQSEVFLERQEVQERQASLQQLLKDVEEACKVQRPQASVLVREEKIVEGEIQTDTESSARIKVVARAEVMQQAPQEVNDIPVVPAPADSSEGKDASTASVESEQLPPEAKSESLLITLMKKLRLLPESSAEVASVNISESPATASDAQEHQRRNDRASQSEASVDTRGVDSEASTAPPASTSDKKDGNPPAVERPRQRKKDKPRQWRLKTKGEYERDEHRKEAIPKKYFDFKSLHDMVRDLPYKPHLSKRAKQEDKDKRRCFLQFLDGALDPNPDLRWTPKQALSTPFICGHPYHCDFKPVSDTPVPSFLGPKGSNAPPATKNTSNVEVPPLPKDALVAGSFSGGGSARTHAEKGSNSEADRQPQSAPASTRGPVEKGASVEVSKRVKEATDQLWAQLLNNTIPSLDGVSSESYRPPVENLCDEFFRTSPRTAINKAYQEAKRAALSQSNSMHRKSASDGNVGGSFCSSASETGSTPNPRHGNQSLAVGTPPFVGSPTSLQGDPRKSVPAQAQAVGSPSEGSPMVGDARKDHASTQDPTKGLAVKLSHGAQSQKRTPTSSTHTPQGGIPHTAHRLGGSQTGSRGSSPWNLPSPMSELSTASERINSSQLSGSDSCGEAALHHEGGHVQSRYALDELSGEDPSQSDSHWRSHQPSDSDGTLTPGSHDPLGTQRTEEEQKYDAQQAQHALWENIKSEMARVELSRDRLPRRFDVTQSPGSANTIGNFREKVGMNESGPVIPFGQATRRDPNTIAQPFSPPSRQQPEEHS